MNTILGPVLLLIFILASLVIAAVAVSLAGAFDFGVRTGDSNIMRQVTPAELMAALIVAIAVACASVLLLKKVRAGWKYR